MARKYERTVEDAVKMMIHAKEKENEIESTTQAFYYPSQAETCSSIENIKLLDIDEGLIKKLESGESLIFKGCNDEKLVLCTESETYEVKEGEISNSLVVCPELMYFSDVQAVKNSERTIKEQKICGIFNSYLELRLTFPKRSKLFSVLQERVYKGPETHECGFYLSELLNIIQCSRDELMTDLKELKACCINGKWTLLGLEYESQVLSYLINLMEEQNWEVVIPDKAKRILKSLVPEHIIDHILSNFATFNSENPEEYFLVEEKLCRSFAEMLLKAGEGKFRYNEFMMALKQCLPKGMNIDLKYLKGLALVEKDGMENQVIYLYPEHDLPENVSERFRLLFKRKEKWTLEEIEPYIKKLATKSMNVNSMLTKFSRASTQCGGVRVYGARHAK